MMLSIVYGSARSTRRIPLLHRLVAGMLIVVMFGGACAADTPEVPVGPDGEPDPVLLVGRDVYRGRCASCHGSSGGGGQGPKLADGAALEDYPEFADQVELVRAGKGLMPAFGDGLTEAELEAVVRYVREVL
jgi:cytochrome c oxidase subunit 2